MLYADISTNWPISGIPEKAKFDDANIPVIYVDVADDENVITLGQIFNCNAKADEVAYVKAALAK